MSLELRLAYNDIDTVRDLFSEYVTMLGVNLDFQNYDEEFAGLPGKYAPPEGRLYLASYNGLSAGCVALRRHDGERCEMKRLFVRPEFRGLGIGRALVDKVVSDAKSMGCRSLILDTQKRLENSVALYQKFGFHEIEPYYHNPYPDVLFLGLNLW